MGATAPSQARRIENLAALIEGDCEDLLYRWRQEVKNLPSAKELDVPAVNNHVPALLTELVGALRSAGDQTVVDAAPQNGATAHGLERYEEKFDIVEIVAEYNILRDCIYRLAEDKGLILTSEDYHVLNRVLDHAIGWAVQTYATQQALEVKNRREEYLAFVAHDLRTPLNAISLAERVLEGAVFGTGGTPELAKMLRTLRRNVQHLQSLTEKILKESAHIQTKECAKLERREFDLWPLVESLIEDLVPVTETAGARLINKVPEDLLVYADAGMLKRVLQNLVQNAIKYAPRGEVAVAAQTVAADGTVECSVTDNGMGIPPDRREAIFEKLETDPNREEGTGLGLALVKTYVEAHGGKVSVDSKEGAGSTFRFTLPGKTKQ